MKLLIEMTLQSDAVFGNGLSIPGGEDIMTQMDDARVSIPEGQYIQRNV